MLLASPTARGPSVEWRDWVRTVGRAGPERWTWSVALLGWVLLAAASEVGPMPSSSGSGHDSMGMGGSHVPAGATEVVAALLMWTFMVAATMLPLIAPNLRWVGLRSEPEHRTRATVDVALGWAVPWLAAGVVLTATGLAARLVLPDRWLVVLAFGLAGAWHCTPRKRVAVARCHRTLAPPLGAAAGRACRRFGVTLGRDCVASCWAVMAAMTAAGHEPLVVLPLAWLTWSDRRRPHERPGTLTGLIVLLATAGLAGYALGT
jgi:predicted metal-binding membrane protein